MANEQNNIIRDVTITHFLLMFGYKLFSLYFPLFLVARGFSLPQVGWTYLLIYLPIALSAPLVGVISQKIRLAYLASIGILGYGAYSLGMIFTANLGLFYFWQVLLGISASLFFTSSRILLMTVPMRNAEQDFSWFYSAPFWADAVAPAIGAVLIWRAGFSLVFALSFAIVVVAAFFYATRLNEVAVNPRQESFSITKWLGGWRWFFYKFSRIGVMPLVTVSFAVLISSGIYHAFFILFLKDQLQWSRDFVLFYTAVSSAFFSFVYIFVIRRAQRDENKRSIMLGGTWAGIFSMLFGIFLPLLNFASVFLLDFARGASSFICNSGRSALLAKNLKDNPQEAGVLDTMFSPLGIALGAIVAGFLIGPLGYQWLFLLSGFFVIIAVFFARLVAKNF